MAGNEFSLYSRRQLHAFPSYTTVVFCCPVIFPQTRERHSSICHWSLPQLLREVYAHGQTIWLLTGLFVFGIATEKVTDILKPHYGFIPSKEIKQEILKCFSSLSQAECNETLMNAQSFFESLSYLTTRKKALKQM